MYKERDAFLLWILNNNFSLILLRIMMFGTIRILIYFTYSDKISLFAFNLTIIYL